MRQGGRYIADAAGKNARRIEPVIGTGKDAKANPEHHAYPDAKPTSVGGPSASVTADNSTLEQKG